MKRILPESIIGTFIFCALAFSCASTPKSNERKTEDDTTAQTVQAEEALPPPPTESELYSKKTALSKLTLLSSPKETTKTKIFTSPYIIKAEDSEGKAVEAFEISVIYPSGRDNGEIVFSETMITTNSEGKAEFLPPTPEYAFNSEISFYPKAELSESTSEEEKSKIKALSQAVTIKAPYKVQTNHKSSGGVIALVDFNQNGKAITSNPVSSSNLLMTLMKLGFVKIGNAPQEVSNAVIQNDEAKIHARASSIAPAFIIFGTVKVDSLEKGDKGFTCTLTGDIKSMDSKTGKITFVTNKTLSVTDKSDWAALANARKALADTLATEIKYGI